MPTMVEGPPRWVPFVRNLESPYWIGNLRHTELRCLIPATAFESGTGKERRWWRVQEEAIFAFAGIWRDLTDMPVFAILTTEPSSALVPVEGKGGPTSMPLILPRAAHDRWLTADWKDAQALVQPIASSALEPFPVARYNMCVVALALDCHPRWRLVLAANRDEYHARETAPLARWNDAPQVIAGRDLQAGGSWLGVSEGGRLAALTNIRTGNLPDPDKASRGALVAIGWRLASRLMSRCSTVTIRAICC